MHRVRFCKDDAERKERARAKAKLRTREQRQRLRRAEAERKGREYKPLGDLRNAADSEARRMAVIEYRRARRQTFRFERDRHDPVLLNARKAWKRKPDWLAKSIQAVRLDNGAREARNAWFRMYYQRNREAQRIRVKRYKHANPHKVKAWGQKRWQRAAAQSDGTLTREQIERVLASKRCAYCSAAITPASATIDHIIPIALGGLHSAHNVIACCLPCNSRKSSRPFREWLDILDGSHRARALAMYRKRFGCDPDQATLPPMFG